MHYCDVTDNIALKTDNGVVSTVDKALQTGAGKLTNCVGDTLNGQCTGQLACDYWVGLPLTKGEISVVKRKHVCEIGPPKIGIDEIHEIHKIQQSC